MMGRTYAWESVWRRRFEIVIEEEREGPTK